MARRNREIHQELADRLVSLREDFAWRRNNPGNRKGPLPDQQAIVGGFVKAFEFGARANVDGATIAHGTFWFEVGDGEKLEHDATFVFLGQHFGDTCYDIVDKTSQLDHEAVLEAYFTAYCEKVGMWIVAYERFDSFLIHTIETKPAELKGFFKDNLRLELRKFWRTTVRNLIRVLALSRTKGVVIGSLGNRHGYVILPSAEIKVFGIGLSAAGTTHGKDLYDLRSLFLSNTFFSGAASDEWLGFDFLLNSVLMNQQPTVWEPVVLKHPILLSPNVDAADNHVQLACYQEIARFMWNDITAADRTAFINALYAAMPAYRWLQDVKLFPRQNIIYTWKQEAVYNAIHAKSSSDSRIYAAVIICVRNLVRHGFDCSKHTDPPGWDKKRIAREIKLLFGGFMSMAYSVSKLPITSWNAMAGVPGLSRGLYR